MGIEATLHRVVYDPRIWIGTVDVPQDVKDRRGISWTNEGIVAKVATISKNQDEICTKTKYFFTTSFDGLQRRWGIRGRRWRVDAAANLDKKSRREVKQPLLRLMATEAHLHKTLRGECVAVQPEIQWFGAAIPHSSIMAVLEFVGVGKAWITFFKRVLEAQLNMESGSERG